MIRRICMELPAEIVKRRPQWASNSDDRGAIKVAIIDSVSDPRVPCAYLDRCDLHRLGEFSALFLGRKELSELQIMGHP